MLCVVLFTDWIWNGKNFVQVSTREWKMVTTFSNHMSYYFKHVGYCIKHMGCYSPLRVTLKTIFSVFW